MDAKLESPHESIEAEIKKLTELLGTKVEQKAGEHRDAVREALKERVYTHTPTAASASSPNTLAPSPSSQQSKILPRYLEDAPNDVKLKVEELVDTAYHKGIIEAVKMARKGGPLVLDGFHDALTDRVYEDLKKRGIIK